jgi:molybdopterin synthase sulfur carrier subunit
MKTITIRYFAAIREAIGQNAETVNTDAPTLSALRDQLIARGGPHAQALARDKAMRVALDHVMSDESTPLHNACEVAFFPPVTGG